MSTPHAKARLALVLAGAIAVLAVAGAAVTRWALVPWAVESALRAGGASDVTFQVERATPWRLQLADLGFSFDAMKFGARRASLERAHWWAASLGKLNVEGAQVEVNLAQASAGGAATPANSGAAPVSRIPLEEISIDGRVILHAAEGLDEAFVMDFSARAIDQNTWHGEARATAPGMELGLEASYRLAEQQLEFHSTALRADLQTWQKWIEHWAPLPAGPWEVAGAVTGKAAGEYRDGRFTARGEFQLRNTRFTNTGLGLVAEGVEADFDVVDLTQFLARKAEVRAATVTSGKIVFNDVRGEFSRTESGRFDVAALSARALGGQLSVAPFVYRLGDTGVEAVVSAEGIQADQVMALTQDLPARATGALSGRLPVRYDDSGLRLGTGWLGLKPGASAEIQFHAAGLLTAGTSPKSPSFAVLKKVEDGILKLKVTELRLDIRPPNAPAGRTAQLHVVGAPVDPEVKAPVTLDLNVNGPIESLINLGMKSGASFGTKP